MSRWNAIFLLIGAAALGWLVYDTGAAQLGAGVARVGWGFSIGCGLHLMALLFDAFAFKQCTGEAGRDVPYWVFIRAGLAGHAINQVTPLGTLGELTKYSLMRDHLPKERVAGAVLLDNFLMLVANCIVLGVGPPIAVLALGLRGPIVPLLFITSAVLAVVGAGLLVVTRRGLGAWPFALARRLRIKAARVDAAQAAWQRIEGSWKETAHDRRRVILALVCFTASRLFDALEQAVILAALGYGGYTSAIGLGFLVLANTTVIGWLTGFVPLQTGTAEGGGYLFFRAIGLVPSDGVLSALVYKVRRVIFVGLGLTVLGGTALRQVLADRDEQARLRAAAAHGADDLVERQ